MKETLQLVKSRLSRQYLGQHGIHGVGVRGEEQAVCLYTTSRAELEASGVLAKIEGEAGPFKVLVIEQPKAFLAKEPGGGGKAGET